MIYGHDRTIHGSKWLDVEVNKDGRVVAVWFRCLALPFRQSLADEDRTKEMDECYDRLSENLIAVETED